MEVFQPQPRRAPQYVLNSPLSALVRRSPLEIVAVLDVVTAALLTVDTAQITARDV